jgi:hypothetical protein
VRFAADLEACSNSTPSLHRQRLSGCQLAVSVLPVRLQAEASLPPLRHLAQLWMVRALRLDVPQVGAAVLVAGGQGKLVFLRAPGSALQFFPGITIAWCSGSSGGSWPTGYDGGYDLIA